MGRVSLILSWDLKSLNPTRFLKLEFRSISWFADHFPHRALSLVKSNPTRTIGSNCRPKGRPEAEFKEFEPRLKFKPRLKYGWFHLKLYSIFQDLSQGLNSLNSYTERKEGSMLGFIFEISALNTWSQYPISY